MERGSIMTKTIFHYTTNEEFEAYLYTLAQRCGFKHKTQLINAVFQGEPLTLHEEVKETYTPQSRRFRANEQQLLTLDNTLRLFYSDLTSVSFDITHCASLEKGIASAEKLTVRNKQYLSTYLHIINRHLIAFDFSLEASKLVKINQQSAFMIKHISTLNQLALSKSKKSKRRITITDPSAFTKSMDLFQNPPLNHDKQEAIKILNIALLQLRSLSLPPDFCKHSDQKIKQLTQTLAMPEHSFTQLEKLNLLLKKATFQKKVIPEKSTFSLEMVNVIMTQLNQSLTACHATQISSDITKKQKMEAIIHLQKHVKRIALQLHDSINKSPG